MRTAGWLSLLHCARGSPSREFLCTAALPGTHLFYKRLQSDVTALLARPRRRRGAHIYIYIIYIMHCTQALQMQLLCAHGGRNLHCCLGLCTARCWLLLPAAPAHTTHMHADNRQPCLLWLPAGPRCAALTDRPLCCQPALQLSHCQCESSGQADPVRLSECPRR